MITRSLAWLILLPFQVLLACATAASDLLGFLLRPLQRVARAAPGDPVPSRELCSIVMLNWNGLHLLQESIPPLLDAVQSSGRPHEVLVVDNGSDDGSVAWLKAHYPEIRLLPLKRNYGFGEGNNRGVRAASHPIVVLLNNDMIVERDFLPPLLQGFSDPDVFAVSSQILFPAGKRREETGHTTGTLRSGRLHLAHGEILPAHFSRTYLPVLWAGGGSSAFRRDRFIELGGFSSIFSPCYVEDTDLSYRAWRRGWKVLVAAGSRVLHKHRSSSAGRFKAEQLEAMIEERKLWYLWKNFQWKTLQSHFWLYPLNLTSFRQIKGHVWAFRKLLQALWSRLREPRRQFVDGEILDWPRLPVLYLNRFSANRRRPSENGKLRLLVASAYLPHLGRHGGAGRVFQLLTRAAADHEVTVLSFVESQEEIEETRQLEPYCAQVETVLRREYDPVSLFPYEPFEEFNCWNFRERMAWLLAERDFDVVHFEWTQMAAYSDLLPPATPSLVTEVEVNYAAHNTLVAIEKNWFRKVRRYYNTLQTLYRELEMCRRVDKVVCVTDDDRNFLRGYLPDEKLEVVLTGVDTRFFHPSGNRPHPRRIAFVGAFRHDPNIDAMHFFCDEVFPLILREMPDVELYIVGSSPPASIRKLDQHPSITVTGFVEDLRPYYEMAQVIVVPLRTGVGIRGKILEAWAAGKAVVATPLACLGIRASHGENVLLAEDPSLFADWTLALLRHPEHCEKMGDRALQTACQFYEWDELGKQISNLYRRVALTDGKARELGSEVPAGGVA